MKLITLVPDAIIYTLVFLIFGWQIALAFFVGVSIKGLLMK